MEREWESDGNTVVEGGCGVGEGSDPSECDVVWLIDKQVRMGRN